MRDEPKVMREIHRIRKEHFLETRGKVAEEVMKEVERNAEALIKSLKLNWQKPMVKV